MKRLFALLLLALCVVACLPVEASPTALPPTETVTLTPAPSATILWFPPTPTFTTVPTQELAPTQDYRPGLRGMLLEDYFTDPATWTTARTGIGSIAFGQQELTLAVSAPQGTLYSLRNSLRLSDFYLEIQMLPSLCTPGDVFGLLLRANSGVDYYRLLINCNGQVRLERLKNSKILPLQDWVGSGQVFPGGLMRLRLGVWAYQEEIRVFINDVYQFSVHDPVWTEGQLGVFARSASDSPLTVSFSNLEIFGLEQRIPLQAVTIPTPAPGGKGTKTATRSP